jgi:hypothetical protein
MRKKHPWRRVCGAGIVVLATLFVLGVAGSAFAGSFTDVPDTHPYKAAIEDLATRQIINGVGQGLFKPDDFVKRQQFAKMIVLTLGLEVPPSIVCPFVDVDTTPNPNDPKYPAKYVAVCAANNITRGVDASQSHFAPESRIKRAQMITMVVRAAENLMSGSIEAVPAGWTGVLNYDDSTHGVNIKKAEYNGLLAGIVGPGGTLAAWDTTGDATRGEVAQLLYNLLNSEESLLPGYADLQPTSATGYDFELKLDAFDAVEDGATIGARVFQFHGATIKGHLTIQLLQIQGADVAVKFVLDSIDFPASMPEAQAHFDDLKPISVRLTADSQGVVSDLYLKLKPLGVGEILLDEEVLAEFVPLLQPIVKALVTPYGGQLRQPGDAVHTQIPTMLDGTKVMDVDTEINFTSFANNVAHLDYVLNATNLAYPLEMDVKPYMPLFGYESDFGADRWMFGVTLGTELLSHGTYDLDVTSGLPVAMSLVSTMDFGVADIKVPDEFGQLGFTSFFLRGLVQHAYVDALGLQFTLTRD